MNEIQHKLMVLVDDLPLAAQPWRAVAERLGWTVPQLCDELRSRREAGELRHVRAMFNHAKVGYCSTLAASACGVDEADRLAAMISASTYVSHNFLREGAELNLWFTVACPEDGGGLDVTIAEFAERLGRRVWRFDVVRHYKISFRSLFGEAERWPRAQYRARDVPVDHMFRAVLALQEELPLEDRPFEALAKKIDMSEAELLTAAAMLKRRGVIRRIGALWDVTKVLACTNVMVVWDAPSGQVDALGEAAGRSPQVSHCYRRETYPHWPWSVYTMIHGRDRQDCLQHIDAIARDFPAVRHLELWTVKEYKQEPVRYDMGTVKLRK